MRSDVSVPLAVNYVFGFAFREAAYLLMGTGASNNIVLSGMLASAGINFVYEVWSGNLKEKGIRGAVEDSFVSGLIGFGAGEISCMGMGCAEVGNMLIDTLTPRCLEKAQNVKQSFPAMLPIAHTAAKAINAKRGLGLVSSKGQRLDNIRNFIPQKFREFTRPEFNANVPVQTFVMNP